ncbi:MAG: hypothetical protein WCI54_12845, partial [Bacteroidia bacterium]
MNRLFTIFLILLLSANCFAQGHFVVAWTDNGYNQMNIKVVTAAIGVDALAAGDEIAAFDGSVCCGKVTLTQPIVIFNNLSFVDIITSESFLTPANGFTPGNTITYKFWDSSLGKEVTGITPEYLNPITGLPITAPVYTSNGSAVVKLTAPANIPPVANAGIDQSVNELSMV